MRTFPTTVTSELNAGRLIARDFMVIEAVTRASGEQRDACFWSGVGNVDAPVVNPRTGGTKTYTFEGAGGVISIGDIPLVSNVTVQNVDVEVAKSDPQVELAIRTYDIRLRPCFIWRGLFSNSTRNLVAPAQLRFAGQVDFADGERAEPEGDQSWKLTLASASQELTRFNTAKRSDKDQHERDANDDFLQYAAVVGEWKISWGKESRRMNDSRDYTSMGGGFKNIFYS